MQVMVLLLLLSVFLQSVLLPRLPMVLLLLTALLLSCRPLSLLIMILLLLLILLLIKSFLLAVHTPHDDDDDILDTPEVTPIVLEHCNNDAGCHWRGPTSHDSL